MTKSKYKKAPQTSRLYYPAYWAAGFGVAGTALEILHRVLGTGAAATTAVAFATILAPLSLGSLLWMAIRIADSWGDFSKQKLRLFIAAALPAIIHLALMSKYLGLLFEAQQSQPLG